MRVLLVDPPGVNGHPVGRVLGSFGINKADQAWPPYDLQILAGYCLKNGHQPKIIDANNLGLSFNDIRNEMKRFNPHWVIYLTCFQTFELDLEIAKIAKQINPETRTACISLSILSVEKPEEKLKKNPVLDFIPWGEPEFTIMQLINGARPEDSGGIYYNAGEGKVNFTGGAVKVKDLDEFGVPIHEGLPFNIYRCPLSIRRPMTIVNCSRGCVNWCVHCQAGAFQRQLRYRSVDNVLQELREVKRLGIKEIKFYDCSLPANRDFAESLMKAMIAERFNFTWNCNARADQIDEQILTLMKQSGCHTISIGCESAAPEILRRMRKNETVEQIEESVRLVKRMGMRVLMYLTFGLEGETEETMNKTFDFAKKLKPDYVTFAIVVPAPGTPFYESLKQKGYLIQKELHLQDPTTLPSFNYPNLSAKQILSFTRRAYRYYYFSTDYIIRRLLTIRSSYEFRASVANALAMVRRHFFGLER